MKDIRKPPSSKTDSQKHRVELISPAKVGGRADGFERNGQAWFVATELQSDLRVEVDTTHFHLHKFPLLSRSGRLNRLVFESRDTEKDHIKLVDLPGGSEAFELAAKFCYGVAVELTPTNVASLRCAAEYLEMTEDLEEGNLISKAEAFLSFVVLASWRDSIIVLQSCSQLIPWADNLHIVQRCSESIAWKACTDPKGIRWSFTGTGGAGKKQQSPQMNAAMNDDFEKTIPQDWWFEDVCVLNTQYFVRTINAIKVKGMRADLLGAAITHYALKWLPGLLKERSNHEEKGFLSKSISNAKEDFAAMQSSNQLLLETILRILPPQRDAVSCNFLLRLLRAANMLNVEVAHKVELEKRAGLQLENASLADLLIPSFSHTCGTLFDVDLVYRIVQYFLAQDQPAEAVLKSPRPESDGLHKIQPATQSAKIKVARVIDGYLAEVASDPELSLQSFQALAEALPENARVCDDGLYKAVDTYLKAHPDLADADRKKLCRNVDSHKLSLDACMHASQNERLPLRMVVQVLFCEQLKLRNAITGCPLAEERTQTPQNPHTQFARVSTSDSDPQSSREGWSFPHTDMRAMQHDVQLMRAEFLGLKNYCSGLQQQLDKLSKHKSIFSWSSGWKKLTKLKASSLLSQGKPSVDKPVSFEAPAPTTPSSNAARRPSRWRRNSVS